ncbi:hypothetical protein MTO96_043349 [Rhipicephalus appendiculatus]
MSNLEKHDFNERLIDEVEKESAIWDMSRQHYKSQQLKEVAWRRVATVTGCNVGEVKARWKNLRDSFRRRFKARHPALKSGAGSRAQRRRRLGKDVGVLRSPPVSQRLHREPAVYDKDFEIYVDMDDESVIRDRAKLLIKDTVQYRDAEDQESIAAHIAGMQREMHKANPSYDYLMDSIPITYADRRLWISREIPGVADVLEKYPALTTSTIHISIIEDNVLAAVATQTSLYWVFYIVFDPKTKKSLDLFCRAAHIDRGVSPTPLIRLAAALFEE